VRGRGNNGRRDCFLQGRACFGSCILGRRHGFPSRVLGVIAGLLRRIRRILRGIFGGILLFRTPAVGEQGGQRKGKDHEFRFHKVPPEVRGPSLNGASRDVNFARPKVLL
jgi:hypothetical protein